MTGRTIVRVRRSAACAAVAMLWACYPHHRTVKVMRHLAAYSSTNATADDWPEIVWADQPPHCSAIVVGPNVAVLAGHCVDQQPPTTIDMQPVTCERSSTYPCPDTMDLAICQTNGNSIFGTSAYGTLPAADSSIPNGPVALVGFGSDSQRRVFSGEVEGPTNDQGCLAANAPIVPGDSGGGAFLTGPGGTRTVIGVISTFAFDGRPPYIVDLTSNQPRAFIERYKRENPTAHICGVNYGAPPCRTPAPGMVPIHHQ